MSVANYEAVIKLIVNGEAALTAVKKEIDEIYKTIGKIEKSGILNSKAAETTLALAKQHANEVERAARATVNQIKQNEQKILQQSRLNAAVDLYERRLTQATNSGAAGLKKFQGQIAQIEAAFKFFKDRGNVKVVQALATELGRMVEYSNNVSRNERARAATLSQLRGFAKQLADYELRGLNTAEAREKFDKLKVVADTNQLNQVKKYTEALVRQLQLLKEKASLQAQIAKDTAAVLSEGPQRGGALGRYEEQQRQLENSKLDEKARQVQAALEGLIPPLNSAGLAADQTAEQITKLNAAQDAFIERTKEASQAANKQTAEFYRMQRVAKQVAELNRTAGPAQLLLPAAKPGSPLMSGGARLTAAQALAEENLLKQEQLDVAKVRRGRKLEAIRQYELDKQPQFDAGTGIQGPAMPPGGLKKKPTGIAGFLGKPGVSDALMGAGFPLLFGAGPGAVLGGGAGGFLGGAMGAAGAAGGPLGMALGIGLSAVGQILDQTFVKVADLGKAVDALNMDGLRDSTVVVNAELEYQVSLLRAAGKAEEARALVSKAVFEQTGLTAGATERVANVSNLLSNAWDGVVGAVGGFVSIIASAVIPALLPILKLVELVFKGWNMILSLIQDLAGAAAKWVLELVFGKDLAERILNFFKGTNEEAEKVKVALAKANDEQAKVTRRAEQSLAIEKMRTNNVSLMGKLINIEADRKDKINEAENAAADKRKAALDEYGGATSAWAKQKLADLLREIDGEKKVAIEKANILALRQRELAINATLVEQDKVRITLLQQQEEIAKARDAANSAVAAAQTQELEQRKQIVMTLKDELSAVNGIYAKKKEVADAAYAATQREAESKLQVAAAELASAEAQKQRGFISDEQLQSAQNLYNTTVATTQENLRGAAASAQAALSAADLEKRQQTVAAYTAQFASEAGRAANKLNEAAAASQNQAAYAQAVYQAQTTINSINIQALQTSLSTTKNTADRLAIVEKIRQLEVDNARVAYLATTSQITAQLESLRIAYKQTEARTLELQAVVALAKAQGLLNRDYVNSLDAQQSALKIAADNLATGEKIATVNKQAAAAVYEGAVQAANLRANTASAAENTAKIAGSMANAAGSAGAFARNLAQAFTGIGLSRPQLEDYQERYIANAIKELSKKQGYTRAEAVDLEAALVRYFTASNKATQETSDAQKIAEFAAKAGITPEQAGGFNVSSKLGLIRLGAGSPVVTAPKIAAVASMAGLTSEQTEDYTTGSRFKRTKLTAPSRSITTPKIEPLSTSYLNRRWDSDTMTSSAGSKDTQINVTTGPVLEFDGEKYVTMPDMEKALRKTVDSVYANLRTPAGRYATGVR